MGVRGFRRFVSRKRNQLQFPGPPSKKPASVMISHLQLAHCSSALHVVLLACSNESKH